MCLLSLLLHVVHHLLGDIYVFIGIDESVVTEHEPLLKKFLRLVVLLAERVSISLNL